MYDDCRRHSLVHQQQQHQIDHSLPSLPEGTCDEHKIETYFDSMNPTFLHYFASDLPHVDQTVQSIVEHHCQLVDCRPALRFQSTTYRRIVQALTNPMKSTIRTTN
jgi:hypothetical protein